MNHERILLIKNLIAMAEIYGKTLSDVSLTMMADDLSDFSLDQVISALKKYRISETSRQFPTVGQIRSLINPETNEDAEAREAVSRIVTAISKYGYTNSDKAKEFIGELGWELVQRDGGWQVVCENTYSENLPTIKAQWRELAKTIMTRSKAGIISVAPQIPKNIKPLVNEILKLSK